MGCCTYFGSALLVATLSWGSYYWYTNIGLPDWYWQARLPKDVEQIDVSDTAALKKILFSGEPWLLQCYSSLPYLGQHLPAPYRVHPVFTDSLVTMRGLVRGGVIDCEKPLPSNKSMVNKFGLVRRSQPLLIFAAGGGKPKQVPAKDVGSAYALTAWVKPKAEPRVRSITSQKQLQGYCGGRRTCLITRLPADSIILEQLARNFRTVEILTLGEDASKVLLSWGRGAEVGETLEPEEERHFGRPISILRPDPHAPPGRKGARPAPRLLRGFNGDEDLPSLSKFVTNAIDADPADDFMKAEMPTVTVKKSAPKKEKKAEPSANDNAEVQARRARARAEKQKKEEETRAAQAAEEAKMSQEARRKREAQRRAKMAEEEEQASNLIEEDDEEDGDAGEDFEGEEEDDGEEVLDLDM